MVSGAVLTMAVPAPVGDGEKALDGKVAIGPVNIFLLMGAPKTSTRLGDGVIGSLDGAPSSEHLGDVAIVHPLVSGERGEYNTFII